jgi:hypothetical protein
MKKLMVILCVSVVLCGTAQAANLLLNADFETNGGFGGTTADNWTETGPLYSDPLQNAVGIEGWANHGGGWGVAFYWWIGPESGIHQDVAVTAGQEYEFKGWMLDDAAAVTTSVYTMTIEWYQGTNLLGSTSEDISSQLTNTWKELGLTGTALTGSDMARVIVSASGMVSGETLKFDDASFVAVPEPVTMTILGLGSLFLARRRK